MTALAEAHPARRQLAFGLLYSRHADAVRAVCVNQLRGDGGSVEDLVQETFLRLLVHAGGLRSPDRVLRWLRRTAKWACRDHRNSAYQRRERASDVLLDTGGVDDFAGLLAEADRVERLLAQLDRRQAAVLRAHYLDGLAVAEIARLMGITVGAAKTLLYRARNEGRRLLEAGKAMIPLPLVEWFARAGEAIKSAPSLAAGVAAALLVPLVAATVLTPPGGAHGSVPDRPAQTETTSWTAGLPVAPADTPAAAVPDRPSAAEGDTIAGATVSAVAEPQQARYVPPSSPTREVDVPAVGQVQTYEEPDAPPDRHIVVAPEATGELVGLRNHDEPELYPAYDAACAASEPLDWVECRH